MSLRLRLVLAFGYVLLFAVIALEVPLTLNFSRRVDSEIKAEAATTSAWLRACPLTSASTRSPRLTASGTPKAISASSRT